MINELEMVNNTHIYANVWFKNIIIKIDKNTGLIEKAWDLQSLFDYAIDNLEGTYDFNDVLNGIAYKSSTNTFFLTGKMWSFTFEVELI